MSSQRPLRAEGYEVIASEHGLDSLQGDVDCVIRAIGRVCSPVVLVGHSYGGSLITAAGTDDRVAPVADLFTQKVDGVAWRTKPSWYIVGSKDHTVNPLLERSAAQRMGATTYEFETSHVPMLSRPDLVLDVVRTAANAVQESLTAA